MGDRPHGRSVLRKMRMPLAPALAISVGGFVASVTLSGQAGATAQTSPAARSALRWPESVGGSYWPGQAGELRRSNSCEASRRLHRLGRRLPVGSK